MDRIQNKITIIFCLGLYLMLIPVLLISQTNKNDKQKNNELILSLSFDELPNTIQVMGKDLNYSKFSRTLKINTLGITQFQGNNVNFNLA